MKLPLRFAVMTSDVATPSRIIFITCQMQQPNRKRVQSKVLGAYAAIFHLVILSASEGSVVLPLLQKNKNRSFTPFRMTTTPFRMTISLHVQLACLFEWWYTENKNKWASCKSPYYPSTSSGRTDFIPVTDWYSVRGELVEPWTEYFCKSLI